MKINKDNKYCPNYTGYSRWKTSVVNIGNIKIGDDNPIALQSMTNFRPMETDENVEQAKRIIDAGGHIVRLTAPSAKDAANLKNIKEKLVEQGYENPLVADIHFLPASAMEAVKYVEKVRINPGNYAEVDKTKIEYSIEEYNDSLDRIKLKVIPLLEECKTRKVALRIGSNHGSLSQRVVSRYGDTPAGMVEAAMEFVRMCREVDFHDIVISMKASNIRVMVQAYRLLANKMMEEGVAYPIHLGVTEAGNGEDGIIKSAAGTGALLYDGIGDTIRVSLTDEPENEIPVAREIIDYVEIFANHSQIPDIDENPINPFEFNKRETTTVEIIGGKNEPVIFGLDYDLAEKEKTIIQSGHYNYVLNDFSILYSPEKLNDRINFVKVEIEDLISNIEILKNTHKPLVLVFSSENNLWMKEIRRMFIYLIVNGVKMPVILKKNYGGIEKSRFTVRASMDFGPLLIDGLGDGVWIGNGDEMTQADLNNFSLALLQATRTRFSRTDFISCPSCGRTLFNLKETTEVIKAKTGHLKGIKIGIMGCIVNGPGEMADADYGFVGAGPWKISLYKGRDVVMKNIPQEEAVDQLIELIKSHGDWKDN